jgi:hypothetical protein
MGHYTEELGGIDRAGREAFIRQNAVALVAERDARITRLRATVRRLERSRAEMRAHVRALQAIVKGLAERAAGQAELLARRGEV